jgi:1-acyl-sn-glycerol-3-phosphate acyltransferase
MLLEKELDHFDPRDLKTYYFETTTTRQILTSMVQSIFSLFSVIRVEGVEHLPQSGGVILAANHMTNFDVFPMQFVLPRLIFFMGKAELFQNPLLDPILRRLGGFPVQRGSKDYWALRHAALVLENEQVLGIFPEGKRSKGRGLTEGKTGAARLAVEQACPVVPMGVEGTEKVFTHLGRRTTINIRLGEPLWPHPHETAQAFTDRIMVAIAALLPENLRGIYAGKVP